MQIVWLSKAVNNLDEAANYIAEDSVSEAIRVVGAIESQVKRLALQPSIGRVGRVLGTRELVIETTRFIVPYRIVDGHVEILRVFHTSQKLPKRW